MRSTSRRPIDHRTTSGVAAIEFVLVFPVLLLLFFGMVNVADYISAARKITQTAALVSDLVARNDKSISSADLADDFIAAEMIVFPLAIDKIRIAVYDYYLDAKGPSVRWKKSSAGGQDCSTPDATKPPVSGLLSSNNDVILTIVCMSYQPPVANFPGLELLFRNVTIERRMALRPRQSAIINCTDCS